MILAKLKNVSGYDYMSRQQLESIFATPPAPKPTLKAKSKSFLEAKKKSASKVKS